MEIISVIKVGEDLYAYEHSLNALLRLNCEGEYKIVLVMPFGFKVLGRISLFYSVNAIWIFSYCENKVILFYPNTREHSEIMIIEEEGSSRFVWSSIIEYKDCYALLPFDRDDVVYIDKKSHMCSLDNMTIKQYKSNMRQLLLLKDNTYIKLRVGREIYYKNKMYTIASCLECDKVICFDIENKIQYDSIINMDNVSVIYSMGIWNDNYMILSSQAGSLIIMMFSNDGKKKYECALEEDDKEFVDSTISVQDKNIIVQVLLNNQSVILFFELNGDIIKKVKKEKCESVTSVQHIFYPEYGDLFEKSFYNNELEKYLEYIYDEA